MRAIAGGRDAAARALRRTRSAVARRTRTLSASTTSIWSDANGGVHVRLVYARAAGSRLVDPLGDRRGASRADHRQLVSIRGADGGVLQERMLDAESSEVSGRHRRGVVNDGSLVRAILCARRSAHPDGLRPSPVPRRRAGRPAALARRDPDDHRVHLGALHHPRARDHGPRRGSQPHRRATDCRVDRLRRHREPDQVGAGIAGGG